MIICILSIVTAMPSRPMNKGRSNDHDFVPPTQYKLSRTKKQLPDLSSLELIPKFEAMDLNNTSGSSQIPHTIDSSSPEALFSLFFTIPVQSFPKPPSPFADTLQLSPIRR
jgi:hypothetical protein